MNNALFEALKCCFCNSPDITLLLDANWLILWESRPSGLTPPLPEQLQIQPGEWPNCVMPLSVDGTLYNCRISGREEDGIRIVQLCTPPDSHALAEEPVITRSVADMSRAILMIHEIMEDKRLYDETRILHQITEQSMRIMRVFQMRREVQRFESGGWEPTRFSLTNVMERLASYISSMLREAVQIRCVPFEKTVVVHCDMPLLTDAVLSAVVLCCHRCEYVQQITFSLYEPEEGTVQICIGAAPGTDRRRDHHMDPDEFGSLNAEHLLLDALCEGAGGKWKIDEEGDCRICRITLPKCPSGGAISLNSPVRESTEYGDFPTSELILARIRIRRQY